MKKRALALGAIIIIFVLLAFGSGKIPLKFPASWHLPFNFSQPTKVSLISEESVTIDIVKKVTPAVVTVGITTNQPVINYQMDPFGFGFPTPVQQGTQQVKQDIGSGFIVKSSGLIVTNKHVVSDTGAKYRVITSDNKSFDVQKIYRDPDNDLAILQITAGNLPTVEMGDSSNLQVGQFALAIGTALGEFRSTVTTGVVSGLGRGITAGGTFAGSEQLSNVIQTSAPINPGNSGGPLLNSSGQVIGVNVAVASDAQNIGFALPINLVKDSLNTFEANGGQFVSKAYLGVEYQMISRQVAIINELPEGAYISSVVADSPADKAGVQKDDIITKVDGNLVRDVDGGLAKIIFGKKPGDTIELTIYRSANETLTIKVTLGSGQP